MRLDWTEEEFYANGGTTSFADRLASSLNIHPSTIKVLRVYSGSLIIDFLIESAQNQTTDTTAVNAVLTQKIANNSIDFGAPLLDASVDDAPVFSTVVDTNNTTNSTTNDTTSGGVSSGPVIIDNNTTTTESEDRNTGGDQGMKQLAIILGIIFGVFTVATVAAFVIYKVCRKPEDKVVKTNPQGKSPGSAEEEDEYDPQYHPKADLGKIFNKDGEKSKQKEYDSVVHEDEEENPRADTEHNASVAADDSRAHMTRQDVVGAKVSEGRDIL